MKNTIEIPAEPIILEQKTEQIKEARERAEATVEAVNEFLESFEKLGFGGLDEDQIYQVQSKGLDAYVREQVAGTAPVMVGGLKLSIEKVQQMVELPDLRAQYKALEEMRRFMPYSAHGAKIENGRAVVDEEMMEGVVKRATTYASTEAEKKAWLLLQQITENMATLYNEFRVQPFDSYAPVVRFSVWHGKPQFKIYHSMFLDQVRRGANTANLENRTKAVA
ncbi:hypothetical protein I5M27_12880 [Adhaeribacter sp. BT258]|uniref:Uncharacterized protein n=1 Tax=Adhaeribacter terrigena TaxID=2793070 RepID=A0ABS1C3X4_9BACT|nr:hypothetical protein [Adhaeribacter terrigena]MBK0403882.1 hypothetical protein [Adhaeribacter terrigena]